MVRKLGACGWTRPSVTVRDGARRWAFEDCPNLDRDDLILSHPFIFSPIQTPAKPNSQFSNRNRSPNKCSTRSTQFLNLSRLDSCRFNSRSLKDRVSSYGPRNRETPASLSPFFFLNFSLFFFLGSYALVQSLFRILSPLSYFRSFGFFNQIKTALFALVKLLNLKFILSQQVANLARAPTCGIHYF